MRRSQSPRSPAGASPHFRLRAKSAGGSISRAVAAAAPTPGSWRRHMDRMNSASTRNSARRYLAIWLRFWAADRWRRAHATDRPFVMVETVGPRREVRAADPCAIACGVAPGQGVADAQALVPDLLVLQADPAGDLAALHKL